MTPETIHQLVYRAKWAHDARAYSIRIAKDRASLNAQIRQSEDGKNALLIEVMAAAMSHETPATANEIADRVVGLSVESAQKYLRSLADRGRAKHVGFTKGETGRGRKLWIRELSQ